MTTIQILIVAFVALSFAYLILKVWDDIRENNAERKAVRYEITAIDIVDFPSMPSRAKNWRFLPKIQTATEALYEEAKRRTPKDEGGPVDVSDELFPKRGKDGKFVKAMPKARVDNFKGI